MVSQEGRNALHYAARRGHVDVADYLLQHGIAVWQTDVVCVGRACPAWRFHRFSSVLLIMGV
jgi:hypothetical protein